MGEKLLVLAGTPVVDPTGGLLDSLHKDLFGEAFGAIDRKISLGRVPHHLKPLRHPSSGLRQSRSTGNGREWVFPLSSTGTRGG